MTTAEKPEKWLAVSTEFYIGTALGFLLASLMLNASSGWAAGIYPIPVLFMMSLGWGVGLIRRVIWKRPVVSMEQAKRRQRLFLWLILPLCIFVPYLGMKTYYGVSAILTPTPPDWTRTSVETTVLGWDNGAGFRIWIEGHNEEAALQFYRQHFEQRGWVDQSASWSLSANKNGTAFTYGHAIWHGRVYFGASEYYLDDALGVYRLPKPGQKRTIVLSYMR